MTSALDQMRPDERAALLADAHAQLAPYLGAEGLVFPVEMLVAVARC